MPIGQRTLGYVDEDFGVVVVIDDSAVWVCRPPLAPSSPTLHTRT
jgi:hypothetical protein